MSKKPTKLTHIMVSSIGERLPYSLSGVFEIDVSLQT